VADDETAADQAAAAKQRLDLLGPGVGCNVEVLGLEAGQQVAYPATDDIGLVAGVLKGIQGLEYGGSELRAGNRVLAPRNAFGFDDRYRKLREVAAPDRVR
jgi:hypothetical protein